MANLFLIRDLCDSKGITIRELARRVKKDESSIQSAIRRGSTNTKTIEAIAAVLEVPVGYFFDTQSADSTVVSTLPQNQETISYLKQILAEKERTIQLLLANQEKN